MEFSTLNESDLHKSLKILYSETQEGITEVSRDGYIYDIVTNSNEIIEIQTKNLSKLLPKILNTIESGYNVKLVHPVVISKRIDLYSQNGTLIYSRKSPKKGSLYTLFDELTGIYPVLLNPKFSLDVIEINMIEERLKLDEKVQSKNKQRRFRKDWIKTNKKLDKILNIRTFKSKEDYLKLLPEGLNKNFCAKDLAIKFENNKIISNKILNYSHLILWVFLHMNIIEYIETKERRKYYKIKQKD